MPVIYTVSSVWVRLSILSQLYIIQHLGLCVFSLPIPLVVIGRIYMWTSCYKRLYSWEYDLRCHNENAKFIEEQLEIISQSEHNEIDEIPIQVRQTRDVIENLKCNKASGWDSIVAENVKYGGQMLTNQITHDHFMNEMLSRGRMPQHYKRGLIVPIPKSNRDCTIKDNNRGITLLTVFYKIFDKNYVE